VFGVLLMGFGVWHSYALYGNTVGTIILLCSIGLCVLMLTLLMKRKTWQRFSLNEEVDSKVNEVESTVKVGTRGVTISRLAPTGKALIEGEQMEVHGVNKVIDPDRPIEVVGTEGYRIDVAEIDDKRFEN
jgi:membrane-bound ClpP family serine protease